MHVSTAQCIVEFVFQRNVQAWGHIRRASIARHLAKYFLCGSLFQDPAHVYLSLLRPGCVFIDERAHQRTRSLVEVGG